MCKQTLFLRVECETLPQMKIDMAQWELSNNFIVPSIYNIKHMPQTC